MKGNLATLKKSDSIPSKGTEMSNIALEVSKCLANCFVLLMKTQAVHWNAEGGQFYSLHKLTELHYENMFKAMDEMAERVRALGFFVPSASNELLDMASIKGTIGMKEMPLSEKKAIDILEKDHMTVVKQLKESIKIADTENDTTTVDMLSDRRAFHEKAAWILRSMGK